jgi:hypothetical protein
MTVEEEIFSIGEKIANSPGQYCLLLGSGISKPNGWDITITLLRRLAKASGENIEDRKLVDWFRNKFKKEPSYSCMFELINGTETENTSIIKNLLPKYDDANSFPLSIQYIAKLVIDGYVKIIITTNFDQNIENLISLFSHNKEIIVIKNRRDLEGLKPIFHCNEPIIIKLNGDINDIRTKHTTADLISKLFFDGDIYNNNMGVSYSRIHGWNTMAVLGKSKHGLIFWCDWGVGLFESFGIGATYFAEILTVVSSAKKPGYSYGYISYRDIAVSVQEYCPNPSNMSKSAWIFAHHILFPISISTDYNSSQWFDPTIPSDNKKGIPGNHPFEDGRYYDYVFP